MLIHGDTLTTFEPESEDFEKEIQDRDNLKSLRRNKQTGIDLQPFLSSIYGDTQTNFKSEIEKTWNQQEGMSEE